MNLLVCHRLNIQFPCLLKRRANMYVMHHIFLLCTTNTAVVETGNCNCCQSITPMSFSSSCPTEWFPGQGANDAEGESMSWRHQGAVYIDVTFTLCLVITQACILRLSYVICSWLWIHDETHGRWQNEIERNMICDLICILSICFVSHHCILTFSVLLRSAELSQEA